MPGQRGKRAHVPPSRLRYEETHPTVSFRLRRELYEQLRATLERSEHSFADFVKEALGVKERTVGAAYNKGYEAAREKYLVTYHCRGCGGLLEVDDPKGKAAARQYTEKGGWEHLACPRGR